MTETNSIEGPGKGKAFFDRAKTVAATGNFDYAIDMYIEGLNREPFNLIEHQALRDTAFRRKMAGGKAPSGLLGPKPPFKGKTPKEALLNAEWLLAKDVGSLSAMMTATRNAALLQYTDIAVWLGTMAREANRTGGGKPKLDVYLELADIFEKLGEFNEASKSIQAAIQLRPNDMELHSRAQRLSAQETLKRGKYEKGEDFKESIKDREATKELLEQENLDRSREYREKVLAQAKVEFEKNPTEVQTITKYSKALREMEEESYENQAIEMLTKAFEQTKVYRFKVEIGDIRIRQFHRNMRLLAEACKADPADKESLRQLGQLRKERLAFELLEFHERAENFPTDLHVKFEYGKRLFDAGKYDDAIVALQEAQNSPKHRVEAMHALGRAFMAQKMVPEAIDTFKKSIEEYDLAQTGNNIAKELYYWYGVALQENKNLKEADEVFSRIVRWDIRYRDAKKRLDEIRRQAENPPPAQPGA